MGRRASDKWQGKLFVVAFFLNLVLVGINVYYSCKFAAIIAQLEAVSREVEAQMRRSPPWMIQ